VVRQLRSQLQQNTTATPIASRSAFARLLSSLAVLEQREGKLNHGSLAAITAAQKLGGSITAFVAGGGVKSVAEEAAKVGGIEKVIAVDSAAYDKVWIGPRSYILFSFHFTDVYRGSQRTGHHY
jgi:electron transfer flavoprotein alpha subunit